jgi:hypothetical protein
MPRDLPADNARAVVEAIKETAGDYKKWALEARKKYIDLRLRQDPEIRGLYLRAADRVADELKRLVVKTPSSRLRRKQLRQMERYLRAEADRFIMSLTQKLEDHIDQAVGAGSGYSQAVTVELLKKAGIPAGPVNSSFARVNQRAVEACWARTRDGLKLSDRIWRQGERLRTTMRDLIQESVATGQDALTTARMLSQYVRTDAKTLARQYPNMMKRMAGRIPGNVSYEALRLARTETTAAFGEGSIAGAEASPSYRGMRWLLSSSHPLRDICDELASHDEGLGPGVYAPGNVPLYPAHPNDLCVLVPVHEQPEDFVGRLKRWQDDPKSEPELEKWFKETYNATDSVGSGAPIPTPAAPAAAQPKAPSRPATKKAAKAKQSVAEVEIKQILKGAPLTDRPALARHLLDASGLTGVPLQVLPITPDWGLCHFDASTGKARVIDMIINSADSRPYRYQVKTVFHELTHARMNGAPINISGFGPSAFRDVEETVAESVSHFIARTAGITEELTPSYAKVLARNLPRLKRLPGFEKCSTIADFGKELAKYRYSKKYRTASWKQLAGQLAGVDLDLTGYAAQYEGYVTGHLEEITDLVLENQGGKYPRDLVRNSIVNGWKRPYNQGEPGFWDSLAVAMNRVGVQ